MMNRSTSQVLAEIEVSLRSIDHQARAGLGDQARLDLITRARNTARIMTNLVSVLVAEAEQAGSAKAAAGTPTKTWLARTGSTGAGEAAGVVKTSRAVTASPVIRDAALSGALDGRQARAIGKVLSELPEGMTAEQFGSAEAFMVHQAKTTPADRLVRLRSDALAAAGYEEELRGMRKNRDKPDSLPKSVGHVHGVASRGGTMVTGRSSSKAPCLLWMPSRL